jgi:glucose-1-phosphate thymidylyltransferase
MIYYPLSVLFLAGIREILIITTPHDLSLFQRLLGDGNQWGVRFDYAIQEKPNGIAQAFIIGESFIKNEPVCLILGDNIFHGSDLACFLQNAQSKHQGASLFGYHVRDPERYGVFNFNGKGQVESIEEKPLQPKSQFAVTGLYLYDSDVVEISKSLVPSKRNELEITDINNFYLKQSRANVHLFGNGFAWLDTGTFDSLLQAGEFVHVLEQRQGGLIASLEAIALKNGWISPHQALMICENYGQNDYGISLRRIVQEHLNLSKEVYANS